MSEKKFKSIFAKEFNDLAEIKRAMGFKYETVYASFLRIDKFFTEQNLTEKKLTKETVELWCRKRSYETEANQCTRISNMRIFCKYLNDIGIEVFIPPNGLHSHPPKYDAHIYTDNELKAFFKAVDQSNSVLSECPYRAMIMPVFFRILYTSGMRVSELRLCKVKDVNLEDGYIRVTNAKNQKERLVPIHESLIERCREIKDKVHQNSDDDEYFFLIRPGTPMTLQNVYRNFRRYLEKADISHTGKGPRVHDLRHTYCINILRKFTDEGKDLLVYLPYMKTILGHESFAETSYYLKLTANRFPYIKEQLEKSFPDIISEGETDEKEFY